ncbi:uncharacterized protein M421DRAFT_100445 [Didymella exigua CBS 183.55]|uniref:Uncharacterized protein n=1 Tax=Didymella exigua CBS 183.55 TaxID=1150837 RepID=A0A6A5RPI1_9PLEO|nr:uncharacterized protein M421DRAFT_100445 [Didymella exigua CBS 183.55]KAF1929333.1 hypothetical protein M421DRAFT_100445 [Didymella exigua CBS 183.55]
MKRHNSSNNKSILHFFKRVPRTSQETSPADAPTTEDTIMTSIETLPPATSQASASSRMSRRVTSNGQQAVLNSESDSDSIGELEFGVSAPKPLKMSTNTGRTTRRTTFEDEPELRRPPRADRNNGRRSFNQLVQTAQKNIDTERKIQEHKAELAKEEEASVLLTTDLDKDTLKQAVQAGEDSDQADRLYKAMQRTNEVRVHTAYHFFEDSPSLSLTYPFPEKSLPEHGWAACFEVPSTRDQAFVTGFAQQIFRLHELPKELATWMIDQICLGHSPALDQKYLEILQTHDEQLQNQLSPKRLDVMFKSIGAQIELLETDAEILPSEAHAKNERLLPPSLKRIATLLTLAAPWLHSKARIHSLHLLCHTCLDDRLLLDSDILNSVQAAIEAVICQYADNRKLASGVGSPPPDDLHSLIISQLTHVLPKLLPRITNPLLQANLIHAFPARSPLTAYLQRHLALSFLLFPDTVDVSLTDPQLPNLIHAHLDNSPHYRMSKDTNYSHVAARLTLLDIAIGPGPTAVPYIPLISPPPSETGSPTPLAPTPASSAVKEFNKEIDALAQHIKLIGNSIVETGAALDLTILEAKERCERLFWRLQHAVRIGGKKAENVFGDDVGKQLKVKKFFKPFPKRAVQKETIFDQ